MAESSKNKFIKNLRYCRQVWHGAKVIKIRNISTRFFVTVLSACNCTLLFTLPVYLWLFTLPVIVLSACDCSLLYILPVTVQTLTHWRTLDVVNTLYRGCLSYYCISSSSTWYHWPYVTCVLKIVWTYHMSILYWAKNFNVVIVLVCEF